MTLSGYAYTCSGGETFDSIALSLYEDEKYASELMCANPEYCMVAVFKGGEQLYLPVIEVPESSEDEMATEPEKAPWKE